MSIAATSVGARSEQSAAETRRFASEYLHGLAPDDQFSAREFCERFPQCGELKSVVLEACLEEYVRRSCGGDEVAATEIASQFPQYRTAIAKQIEVYRFLEEASGDRGATWPEPGDEFLGLDLHELLGVGAFSRVFRATERRLGDRQVVAKVCRGAGNEAAYLGRLGHPHVTPIYWHKECEETGLSAIVMPYLARSTMSDVIDLCFSSDGPPARLEDVAEGIVRLHPEPDSLLTPAELSGCFADGALRWTQQLVDALAFAHQHHICHADIKPSNVLLTPSGDAVLVDFGLANDLEVEQKTIGGTFPYMAPEQLKAFLAGRDIPVSFASDLFSLGVTLYEFLTGRMPFGHPPTNASRHSTAQWLLDRQEQQAVPVCVLNPQIPGSLSSIVMQCIALRPSDRPESAARVLKRLEVESGLARRTLNRIQHHWKILLPAAAVLTVAVTSAMLNRPIPEPEYRIALSSGFEALRENHWAAAEKSLTTALQELEGLSAEPGMSDVEASTRYARGYARLKSDDFRGAARDFSTLKAIDRYNGQFTAGLAYANARLVFAEDESLLRSERRSQIELARAVFKDAEECGLQTPAVQFDVVLLDYCLLASLTSSEIGDNGERIEKLESIESRLNAIPDVVNEIPNARRLLDMIRHDLQSTRRTDSGGAPRDWESASEPDSPDSPASFSSLLINPLEEFGPALSG